MADLTIRVMKGTEPKTTIRIPIAIVRVASGFVPARAIASLREQGFDLQELVRLSESPEIRGPVAVIEDHIKGETTTISIE